MSFGDRLRSLLEERGITQKELASRINIAASTMGCYVQNIREPDFATLKLLADYFDVSTDFLLEHPSKHSESKLDDDLLRIFHSLSEDHKALFLEQGRAFIRLNLK